MSAPSDMSDTTIKHAKQTLLADITWRRTALTAVLALGVIAGANMVYQATRNAGMEYTMSVGSSIEGATLRTTVRENGTAIGVIVSAASGTHIEGKFLERIGARGEAAIARYLDIADATRGKTRKEGIDSMKAYIGATHAENQPSIGRPQGRHALSGLVISLMASMWAGLSLRKANREFNKAVSELEESTPTR